MTVGLKSGKGKIKVFHGPGSAPAIEIDHHDPWRIYQIVEPMEGIHKVIIDEASFFPREPFLEVIKKFLDENKEIIVGGLAYDANRDQWGPILELLKLPEVEEIVLSARCDGQSGRC